MENLVDVSIAVLGKITPESAQADVEDLQKLVPTDPDYEKYYSL